jgi:hypothetical protein
MEAALVTCVVSDEAVQARGERVIGERIGVRLLRQLAFETLYAASRRLG